MSFKVVWSQKADSQIRKLSKGLRKRIYEKVDSIRDNPYAFAKRLFGSELYSLRVGDYRVIMNIKRNVMIVFIVKVGHRKDVYEKH
ncbi:addiction module toxin RelE [Candidatus Micrarchaeota archaeon RBG_16_49_10]|nr:MAG: addiction module toxin RelE [Candidatus Micrarchaeota archaeon RBG_16_49_10]